MTDVSRYSGLKQKATELYKSLAAVRKEIRNIEEQMLLEITRTQQPLSVTADNRTALIRVQDRRRRLPLTEAHLKDKLRECLTERFGTTVSPDSIAEFAVSISKRIWSERRIKTDQKISMKMSV
jgi:hypothetical protein